MPKITHGAETRSEVKKYERIIDEFAKVMKAKVKKLVKEKDGLGTPVAPTVEALLGMRQALVRAVEKGMLERQDQEEIIGILAAAIWFNRLEEGKQHAITDYWG